jgi:hypothetical protein
MRREDSFGRDRLVARCSVAWCVLRLAGGRGVLAPSVEAAAVTGATVASPLPDAAIAAPSSPISLRNGASAASPARAASDVIAASSASLGCAELVTVVPVVQSRTMRLPWLAARRQSSPAPFRGRDRAGGRGRARTGREPRTRRTAARPPRQYVHRPCAAGWWPRPAAPCGRAGHHHHRSRAPRPARTWWLGRMRS